MSNQMSFDAFKLTNKHFLGNEQYEDNKTACFGGFQNEPKTSLNETSENNKNIQKPVKYNTCSKNQKNQIVSNGNSKNNETKQTKENQNNLKKELNA